MLRKDVFVLKTDANVLLLVHPIKQNGRKFMPVTYGYATTIRRAQGATLELVGVCFDRRLADHGYGYVAVSRARRRTDVYLIGSIRRTDWRPVEDDDRILKSGPTRKSHFNQHEISIQSEIVSFHIKHGDFP